MQLKLDTRFKRKVAGMIGKYSFEVGVLNDKAHKKPLRGERGKKGEDVKGNYAGGPIRKTSRVNSGLTIAEVSKENRERLGINYLVEPFQNQNSDIIKFTQAFLNMVFSKGSQKRRVENLLQAIVRNPILRGEYGPQGPLTTKIKGFDRPMIDTAQLFKNIKATCKIGGS